MRELVAKLWKFLPAPVRLQVVRAAQQKYTASAAAIILDEKSRVLLLEHSLRPYSPWGLPGGFIDANEQPECAIRREIMEEMGIELNDLELFRVRTIRRHVEVLYTAKPVGEARIKSREIRNFGWFHIEDFPSGVNSPLRELVRSVLDERSQFDRKQHSNYKRIIV